MAVQTNIAFQSRRNQQVELTRHARVRAQKRGIAAQAVRLIKAYGERSYDQAGGIRFLMTEKSMRDLESAIGRNSKADELKGTYIVLSAEDEATVITVGHRYS
jgi:hypothetical protein